MIKQKKPFTRNQIILVVGLVVSIATLFVQTFKKSENKISGDNVGRDKLTYYGNQVVVNEEIKVSTENVGRDKLTNYGNQVVYNVGNYYAGNINTPQANTEDVQWLEDLQSEFKRNYKVLQHNDEWIQKNYVGSMNAGKIVIIPLQNLSFEKWNKWEPTLFNKVGKNQYGEMEALYSKLNLINAGVIERTNYKLANEGKPGFEDRLRLLDKNIDNAIKNVEVDIERVGNFLFKDQDWKTKFGRLVW